MATVKSCGNVFADLGFDAQEAANLKLRSQLIVEVEKNLAELINRSKPLRRSYKIQGENMNLIQNVILKTNQTEWKIEIGKVNTSAYIAGLWKSGCPVDTGKIIRHKTSEKAFTSMAKLIMSEVERTPEEISNPLGNTFLSDEDIGRILESL